jgi:hypothetical protein
MFSQFPVLSIKDSSGVTTILQPTSVEVHHENYLPLKLTITLSENQLRINCTCASKEMNHAAWDKITQLAAKEFDYLFYTQQLMGYKSPGLAHASVVYLRMTGTSMDALKKLNLSYDDAMPKVLFTERALHALAALRKNGLITGAAYDSIINTGSYRHSQALDSDELSSVIKNYSPIIAERDNKKMQAGAAKTKDWRSGSIFVKPMSSKDISDAKVMQHPGKQPKPCCLIM